MPIFPVDQAKEFLIKNVKDSLSDKNEYDARTIVDLHLDPNNFAMPIIIDDHGIQIALRNHYPLDDLRKNITFENTKTIQGICRVMVRTHLNRSGVNYVSRGFKKDKTKAQRVLGLFQDDFCPQKFTDFTILTSEWIEYADNSTKGNACDEDGNPLFNETDIDSLNKLSEKMPNSIRTAEGYGIHNNWAKIVFGVHSGFNYLYKICNLDADLFWKLINEASNTLEGVENLINNAKNEVIEYGPALAGSFFADLGCAKFIKADVHVKDAIAAFLRKDAKDVSAKLAFDILQESSNAYKISPRALDKILYLAGSSNLYLVGTRPSKAEQTKRKEAFLKFLKEI